MNQNSSGRILMAGLVGLGLGLLFAPRSGDDTRKDVKDKMQEAKDKAETIAGRTRRKWGELKEEIRRDLQAPVDAAARENEEIL